MSAWMCPPEDHLFSPSRSPIRNVLHCLFLSSSWRRHFSTNKVSVKWGFYPDISSNPTCLLRVWPEIFPNPQWPPLEIFWTFNMLPYFTKFSLLFRFYFTSKLMPNDCPNWTRWNFREFVEISSIFLLFISLNVGAINEPKPVLRVPLLSSA